MRVGIRMVQEKKVQQHIVAPSTYCIRPHENAPPSSVAANRALDADTAGVFREAAEDRSFVADDKPYKGGSPQGIWGIKNDEGVPDSERNDLHDSAVDQSRDSVARQNNVAAGWSDVAKYDLARLFIAVYCRDDGIVKVVKLFKVTTARDS